MSAPDGATPLARLSDACAHHLMILGDALDSHMLSYRHRELSASFARLMSELTVARAAIRSETREAPAVVTAQPTSGMVWDAIEIARKWQRAAEATTDSDDSEETGTGAEEAA